MKILTIFVIHYGLGNNDKEKCLHVFNTMAILFSEIFLLQLVGFEDLEI